MQIRGSIVIRTSSFRDRSLPAQSIQFARAVTNGIPFFLISCVVFCMKSKSVACILLIFTDRAQARIMEDVIIKRFHRLLLCGYC